MKIVCINDSDRPSRIPEEYWVKKGQKYTILKAVRMSIQNGKIGFVLEEIDLPKACFPYEAFSAERFVPESLYDEEERYEKIKMDEELTIE